MTDAHAIAAQFLGYDAEAHRRQRSRCDEFEVWSRFDPFLQVACEVGVPAHMRNDSCAASLLDVPEGHQGPCGWARLLGAAVAVPARSGKAATRLEPQIRGNQLESVEQEVALAHQPGHEGALFKNAIGAAFAEVVKPKGEPSPNENVARALAEPQRSAASNEVARLKQENAQLRQWLAQCGVLPM